MLALRRGVRCSAGVVVTSSFAALLRHHRLALGLTQEELAERAQLGARVISDLERGLKQAPRPSTVRLLVRGLQLPEAEAAALLRAARPRGDPVPDTRPSHDRHNLPLPLTSLVGRERELAAVRRLLERNRLVTLTGAGGLGKPRLALEAARRLAGDYVDGTALVELAALTDPGRVPQAVTDAAGVREQPGWPLRETLLTALQHRHLLLVLDNCEHLVEACAEIGRGVAAGCPKLRILATSRQPLHLPGEAIWRVLPLDAPDPHKVSDWQELASFPAVQLLQERAQAVEPSFELTETNAWTVAHLCARLDGLPLAIELAAARLRVLDADSILARVERGLDLLTTESRQVPPRHRALRATVDWSHSLLAPCDRLLFRRLAVFVGGCSLEAAEEVCTDDDTNPSEVLEGITRLIDSSLVLRDAATGRFRMLETIRIYALQELARADEIRETRARHLRYFLELSEVTVAGATGPAQTDYLNRLQADQNNVRVALEWSVEHQQAELAARLAGAMWLFWRIRSIDEGRRWLDRVLTLPGIPARSRAALLAEAGSLARYQADYRRALTLYEDGLDLARFIGDELSVTYTLSSLAMMYCHTGDYARARVLQQESLARAQAAADHHAEGVVLQGMGVVAEAVGDYETAERLQCEGLERLKDKRGIGIGLICLADAVVGRGDVSRGNDLYAQGLAILREIDDAWAVGFALAKMAGCARTQTDFPAALRLAAESLTLLHECGDWRWIASCLRTCARAGYGLGEVAWSARVLGAEHEIRALSGDAPTARERLLNEQLVAMLQAQLGNGAWRTAWERGRRVAPGDAVADALKLCHTLLDRHRADYPRRAPSGSITR